MHTKYQLLEMSFVLTVIQWLNKQINEQQLIGHRVGAFDMPVATSNFRPTGASAAVVCHQNSFYNHYKTSLDFAFIYWCCMTLLLNKPFTQYFLTSLLHTT